MNNTPVATPLIVPILVEKIMADNAAAGELAHAFDTLLRHSMAGKCARQIGFDILGAEREPFDAAGQWVMWIGSQVHEALQEAVQAKWGPEAVVVEAKVRWDDLDASGHIDILVRLDGRLIAVELKTIGGFGFTNSIGVDRYKGTRKPPEGPRVTAKLQGALNALAVDADLLIIGEIALEAVSKNQSAAAGLDEYGRFMAEWHYERREFEPWARAEKARLGAIAELLRHQILPDTWAVSDKGKEEKLRPNAINPKSGLPWDYRCGYCPHHATCKSLPEGEVQWKEVAA